MKKNKLYFLASISFVIALFVFSGTALAACTTTERDTTSKYGVTTGSSTSLAGLVVHTKNNGTNTNMNVTVSEGQTGSGVCNVTSSYGQGTCASSDSWNSGSTFYTSGQSETCSKTGYLILGYGSSNDYGNKQALDCKNSSGTYFEYTVTLNAGPLTASGKWDYSVSGEKEEISHGNTGSYTDNKNPYVKIKVNNGYTAWVTFNWVPATVDIDPTISAPDEVDPGSTFYITQTVKNNGTQPVYDLFIRNNAGNNGIGATESGTQAAPYDLMTFTNNNYNPDIDQPAGSYESDLENATPPLQWLQWRRGSLDYFMSVGASYTRRIQATARSEAAYHGKYMGTNMRSFASPGTSSDKLGTVVLIKIKTPTPPPVQSLSCAVVPQTGAVPFKVTVNVTPTNVSGVNADTLYTFNMGDGISTGIQRKSGFTYTYNTAGSYTVAASYNALSASCSPNATVTDPRGGSGGEVAP